MGCTHPSPCRSSETPATWPGGLHGRRRQDLAELHLKDRPRRVLVGIRRTNKTAQSSVPCMSYSISWGIAAVHQVAYRARYAVLLRSRRLSTTSYAPRCYGASESEVALARMRYGIDGGSYHVFYHNFEENNVTLYPNPGLTRNFRYTEGAIWKYEWILNSLRPLVSYA